MMKNILLSLCYDGSPFFGWQKTQEGPSIEAHLEEALFSFLHTRPYLQAASRTDRGVHAKDQKVNFFTPKPLSLTDLLFHLQKELPPSIAVFDAKETPLFFHPSLHAKKKEYRYQISLGPYQSAFSRFHSWHHPIPLDRKKMEKASLCLVGQRDFSAFSSLPGKNPLCTLFRVEIVQKNDTELTFVLEGDRFLYHMARTLVGTLVAIGNGKLEENSLASILASKDRRKAGPTAPALGLFLEKITYLL
jgi:tRNA pseudouridine38-40 synthase